MAPALMMTSLLAKTLWCFINPILLLRWNLTPLALPSRTITLSTSAF